MYYYPNISTTIRLSNQILSEIQQHEITPIFNHNIIKKSLSTDKN